MTTYRRPSYTKQVFESLNKCKGIEEYTLFIQAEPDMAVRSLLENFAFKPKVEIKINNKQLGCKENNLTVLEWAFEYTDYNIHVEDDILLSEDALTYFEWCKQFKDDKDIFTVTGYNKEVTKDYYKVMKVPWFVPWGWATWIDRFKEIPKIREINDEYTWDDQINRNIRKERMLLKPLLARCQNIGSYGGCHIPSPQWHINNQYNSYWYNSITVPPGEFHL